VAPVVELVQFELGEHRAASSTTTTATATGSPPRPSWGPRPPRAPVELDPTETYGDRTLALLYALPRDARRAPGFSSAATASTPATATTTTSADVAGEHAWSSEPPEQHVADDQGE
jgi:hypothetical protein